MKGMIFTEFLDLVEEQFGLGVVQTMINTSDCTDGGAYTAVGTYDHKELVRMVSNLSTTVDVPVSTLLQTFGKRTFKHLADGHPVLMPTSGDLFSFLESIDAVIHEEVRKLYPDAALPSLVPTRTGEELTLEYKSPRCLADVAEGLLYGSFEYFDEQVALKKEDLSSGKNSHVRFTIYPRKHV